MVKKRKSNAKKIDINRILELFRILLQNEYLQGPNLIWNRIPTAAKPEAIPNSFLPLSRIDKPGEQHYKAVVGILQRLVRLEEN